MENSTNPEYPENKPYVPDPYAEIDNFAYRMEENGEEYLLQRQNTTLYYDSKTYRMSHIFHVYDRENNQAVMWYHRPEEYLALRELGYGELDLWGEQCLHLIEYEVEQYWKQVDGYYQRWEKIDDIEPFQQEYAQFKLDQNK